MIVQGLNALVGFVTSFFVHLLALGTWLLDGVLYVLKGGLYFIFDGLLTVVGGLITAINFGSLASVSAASWAGLPPQLIYLINAAGLPAGLAMVGTAIGIRLALNLIPAAFTRL